MSVFVSYSHKDREFVDRLCAELIKNDVKVWKDKWQIRAGDSFINKIKDGIETASFLCVVLSKKSIKSEWVEMEINAALTKETEKKGITILPLMLEDCELPSTLQDRVFIDFRSSFENGFSELLNLVARKYNVNNSGRLSEGLDYYFDYLVTEGTKNEKYIMRVDIVAFDIEEDFSILAQIEAVGNEFTTKEYLELAENEQIKDYVLRGCIERYRGVRSRIKIIGNAESEEFFTLHDAEQKAVFLVRARVVRLGSVSKNVVLFNLGAFLVQMCKESGII